MALVLESAFQECYACAFLPEATHKIRLGWRRTIKAYKLATINYKPLQSATSIDASARARCQIVIQTVRRRRQRLVTIH